MGANTVSTKAKNYQNMKYIEKSNSEFNKIIVANKSFKRRKEVKNH